MACWYLGTSVSNQLNKNKNKKQTRLLPQDGCCVPTVALTGAGQQGVGRMRPGAFVLEPGRGREPQARAGPGQEVLPQQIVNLSNPNPNKQASFKGQKEFTTLWPNSANIFSQAREGSKTPLGDFVQFLLCSSLAGDSPAPSQPGCLRFEKQQLQEGLSSSAATCQAAQDR